MSRFSIKLLTRDDPSEAWEDALEQGIAFDFEGSAIRGVERFFRGFGPERRHPTLVRREWEAPFEVPS